MRTVVYGAACSLDGYITARDGAIDWLHFSKDVEQVMRDSWAGVDTVLIGRKSWEVTRAMSGGKGDGSMPGITTYLFSRTLREAPSGVRLVAEDAGPFVRELKRQPGGKILIMGGGELGQSLFEADVIDEVGVNVHPVLLGAGVPLFRDAGRRVPLELVESRVLDGGCVLATYRVRHA